MKGVISSGLAAALVVIGACSGSGNTKTTVGASASTDLNAGSKQTGGSGTGSASTDASATSSDKGVARYQQYSGGTLSYSAALTAGASNQVWTITTAACGKFSGTLTTPDQAGYTVVGTYDDTGKVLTFTTTPALPLQADFTATQPADSHCTYRGDDSLGLVCPNSQSYPLTGVTLTLSNPSAWKNHGDFVSSVAKDSSSTSEQIVAAAQSCIGKPITSSENPSGGSGECSTPVTWSKGTLSYTIGGGQYEEWAITATSSGRFFGYLGASNPVLPNGAIIGTYDPTTNTVLSFVTTQPEQGCVFLSTPPVALTCPSNPGYPSESSGQFLTTNTSLDEAGHSGVNFTLDQPSSSCIDLPLCAVPHESG